MVVIMNKLYYNIVTKEYGINFDQLRYRFPAHSIPKNINVIEDYISYNTSPQPFINSTFQMNVEALPFFNDEGIGSQVWNTVDREIGQDIIDALKEQKRNKATSKRKSVEHGGLTFPNGIRIKTAKADQDRMLSVIVNAERDGITEINFKAESGWAKITISALGQIVKILTRFVQHCFNIEMLHHNQIDLLTNAQDILDYNVESNWDFNMISTDTVELNIHGLNAQEVIVEMYREFMFPVLEDDKILIDRQCCVDAQKFLNQHYFKMPDLLPMQFYYLMAKLNIDETINDVLLPNLKNEDVDRYLMYKSYLYGARYYEFSKAISMYMDIKEKILLVNPGGDYTVDELKAAWMISSKI